MNRRTRNRWRQFAFLAAIPVATIASDPAHAADLSGCWTGHWESCTTGHTGPLEATFCRLNASQYQVDFRGRFFKVVPFRYSVTLDVVREDGDSVELAGSSYLGRLFGTFRYTAQATSSNFTANYTSCNDNGRFILCRTGCCEPK